MTGATVLAGLAGIIVAVAIADLAPARRWAVMKPRRSRLAFLNAPFARTGTTRGGRAGTRLAARIDAAGLNAAPADVAAMKVAAVPAATLAALPLAGLAPARLGLTLLLTAPVAGFLAPDAWLAARARARARTIEAEQADVLDLLRVAVGAGLTPWRAVAEVGRRHPGVLARELAAAARRVALGMPTEQALDRLEQRCRAAGIRGLTTALKRADRLGAPPGRALGALAEEARARQARRAAEHAARAAPKIQLVVALLLVPSVLLLVAAAVAPTLTGASP